MHANACYNFGRIVSSYSHILQGMHIGVIYILDICVVGTPRHYYKALISSVSNQYHPPSPSAADPGGSGGKQGLGPPMVRHPPIQSSGDSF
jgi:hypothetical protein